MGVSEQNSLANPAERRASSSDDGLACEVPESRRAARTRETRRRLLEAGRTLFTELGPRAVTSHAIADEAGYASGTFYLHFKDKHALFRELAEEAANELEQRLLAVSASKTDVADVVFAQADALVGFAEAERQLLQIVFHPDGEAGDVGARILERLAAGVSARRQERAAHGNLDPTFNSDVLAQAIVGMWARVLAWWAEDPTRARREDLIRTLTHFQLYGSRHESTDACRLGPASESEIDSQTSISASSTRDKTTD